MEEEKMESAKEEKMEEINIWREIGELVVTLAIVVAAAVFIVTYVAQRTSVDGESMMDTLQNGDQLFVEKVTYRFSDPKRFDIIVFELKDDPKIHYIKRIIGLPGETVQIVDGYIYINGQLLEENYGKDDIIDKAGYAADPVVLGADEYFVLGDNRNNSTDSRNAIRVGKVKRSQIVGRAFIRVWPFKSFGLIKHGD
ncbi:MAG: signal peptidase I [Lachnospiraceae bacterium]